MGTARGKIDLNKIQEENRVKREELERLKNEASAVPVASVAPEAPDFGVPEAPDFAVPEAPGFGPPEAPDFGPPDPPSAPPPPGPPGPPSTASGSKGKKWATVDVSSAEVTHSSTEDKVTKEKKAAPKSGHKMDLGDLAARRQEMQQEMIRKQVAIDLGFTKENKIINKKGDVIRVDKVARTDLTEQEQTAVTNKIQEIEIQKQQEKVKADAALEAAKLRKEAEEKNAEIAAAKAQQAEQDKLNSVLEKMKNNKDLTLDDLQYAFQASHLVQANEILSNEVRKAKIAISPKAAPITEEKLEQKVAGPVKGAKAGIALAAIDTSEAAVAARRKKAAEQEEKRKQRDEAKKQAEEKDKQKQTELKQPDSKKADTPEIKTSLNAEEIKKIEKVKQSSVVVKAAEKKVTDVKSDTLKHISSIATEITSIVSTSDKTVRERELKDLDKVQNTAKENLANAEREKLELDKAIVEMGDAYNEAKESAHAFYKAASHSVAEIAKTLPQSQQQLKREEAYSKFQKGGNILLEPSTGDPKQSNYFLTLMESPPKPLEANTIQVKSTKEDGIFYRFLGADGQIKEGQIAWEDFPEKHLLTQDQKTTFDMKDALKEKGRDNINKNKFGYVQAILNVALERGQIPQPPNFHIYKSYPELHLMKTPSDNASYKEAEKSKLYLYKNEDGGFFYVLQGGKKVFIDDKDMQKKPKENDFLDKETNDPAIIASVMSKVAKEHISNEFFYIDRGTRKVITDVPPELNDAEFKKDAKSNDAQINNSLFKVMLGTKTDSLEARVKNNENREQELKSQAVETFKQLEPMAVALEAAQKKRAEAEAAVKAAKQAVSDITKEINNAARLVEDVKTQNKQVAELIAEITKVSEEMKQPNADLNEISQQFEKLVTQLQEQHSKYEAALEGFKKIEDPIYKAKIVGLDNLQNSLSTADQAVQTASEALSAAYDSAIQAQKNQNEEALQASASTPVTPAQEEEPMVQSESKPPEVTASDVIPPEVTASAQTEPVPKAEEPAPTAQMRDTTRQSAAVINENTTVPLTGDQQARPLNVAMATPSVSIQEEPPIPTASSATVSEPAEPSKLKSAVASPVVDNATPPEVKADAAQKAIENFNQMTAAYKRALLSNNPEPKIKARGEWAAALRELGEHVDEQTKSSMEADARREIKIGIDAAIEAAKPVVEVIREQEQKQQQHVAPEQPTPSVVAEPKPTVATELPKPVVNSEHPIPPVAKVNPKPAVPNDPLANLKGELNQILAKEVERLVNDNDIQQRQIRDGDNAKTKAVKKQIEKIIDFQVANLSSDSPKTAKEIESALIELKQAIKPEPSGKKLGIVSLFKNGKDPAVKAVDKALDQIYSDKNLNVKEPSKLQKLMNRMGK